jgi:hypothetical protein
MCETNGASVEGNFSLIPFEPMGDIDECTRRYADGISNVDRKTII